MEMGIECPWLDISSQQSNILALFSPNGTSAVGSAPSFVHSAPYIIPAEQRVGPSPDLLPTVHWYFVSMKDFTVFDSLFLPLCKLFLSFKSR